MSLFSNKMNNSCESAAYEWYKKIKDDLKQGWVEFPYKSDSKSDRFYSFSVSKAMQLVAEMLSIDGLSVEVHQWAPNDEDGYPRIFQNLDKYYIKINRKVNERR